MIEIPASWPEDFAEEESAAPTAAEVKVLERFSSPYQVVHGIRVPLSRENLIRSTSITVVSPEGRTIVAKEIWDGKLPFYGLRTALAKRSANRIASRFTSS